MHNPALRQQTRSEQATPIPLQHDASMLDWLESTGRLLARDTDEKASDDENEQEISDLMGNDDGYDDDDDDDLDVEED